MDKKRHSSVPENHQHKRARHDSRNKEKDSKYPHNLRGVSSRGELDRPNDFTWETHKTALDKMFFRKQDMISKGSADYKHFWTFLKKYEQKKKTSCKGNLPGVQEASIKSDVLSKIPFRLKTGDQEELNIRAQIFKDDTIENTLTENRIKEFISVLHMYIDFLQKQCFNKLRELRRSQSNLPIARYHETILKSVQDHQVVLIAGDTGCGKSTQVPQYLLAAGFDRIACTQPRRIACISLCKRVAFETLNDYKDEVGYQIRFEKHKSQRTRILFLTEGLLLRQLSNDQLLSNYDVIILDEVHERHLSCDFLLGIVKCLVQERKDLKVVLMSATINIQLFSEYFGNCPIIQVPGRMYPIQVLYRKLSFEERTTRNGRLNPGPYIRVLQEIDNKYPAEERGDLLIFLSGMTEISLVVEAAELYAEQTKRWIILPLHSSLSLSEQDKVFDYAPAGIRKCIVSTNIAETSVTIDGVRFVLDSGKVKELSYDTSCRMERLKEFWVSKASAEQRKGRAGRTGPGLCYRLYSQEEYESLSPYSTPEIQRVPLDSLLLQMISMGLPDARKFPFLEPPSEKSIEDSIQGLKEQGALTSNEELSPMGRVLSHLPVDGTIGKMLVLGCAFDLLNPVLSLAAALSVQSPLTNRAYKDVDAMAARKSLESDHGDPFTLLNAFHEWLNLKSGRESRTSQKWCKRRGLEEQRFYEMTKLRKQFKQLLQDSGIIENDSSSVSDSKSDRVLRHGELKMLHEIKREHKWKGPRVKKILKLGKEIEGISNPEEDETEETNIHDVDFRLAHNCKEIMELTSTSCVHSYTQMSLLKVILCKGLYPQVSLLDEHCATKDSDQICHTKGKPFVLLHPMSVFALNPDLIVLRDEDVISRLDFHSRQSVSTKHQLLFYMSLLETTKPYLINCVRVPAAHTMLLLADQIDTNQNFTRVVCSGWLEIHFPEEEAAQQMVAMVLSVRELWDNLLQTILKDAFQPAENKKATTHELAHIRRSLRRQMDKLFKFEVQFTIKRLLPADLKDLYVGPQEGLQTTSTIMALTHCNADSHIKVHPIKGGLMIKDFLTYNCLCDPDTAQINDLKPQWICPDCSIEMQASPLEQVRHREKCSTLNHGALEVEETPKASHANKYFCEDCQKELLLTVTEILRHKRNHALKTEFSSDF